MLLGTEKWIMHPSVAYTGHFANGGLVVMIQGAYIKYLTLFS